MLVKQDQYVEKLYIYICWVSIFMSKLQYIYPDCNIYIYIYPYCNICIQVVIYMSKMSIDIYPNAVSMVRFIYNFRRFFTYLQTVRCIYVTQFFDIYTYFPASTICKRSWIDSHRLQTKWRLSRFQNVLIWPSIPGEGYTRSKKSLVYRPSRQCRILVSQTERIWANFEVVVSYSREELSPE